MRRGLHSALGKDKPRDNFISPEDAITGTQTLFKSTNLDKSKLPDSFIKAANDIHTNTKQYLDKAPDTFTSGKDSQLHRGYKILDSKKDSIHLGSGIFSTARNADNAHTFSGLDEMTPVSSSLSKYKDKFTKNDKSFTVDSRKERYMNDTITYDKNDIGQYLNKDVFHRKTGFSLSFDANKIQKDNNIFAMLTGDGLDHLKKAYPDIKFKGGETEVIIIT